MIKMSQVSEEFMPTKTKLPAQIHHEQTVSEAFAAILQHNLDYLIEWQSTAGSWENIEGVHQVRVSLRRMRSALNLFRKAIPKTITGQWNIEMRELAGELGMARDLDVFIDEALPQAADQIPLPGHDALLQIASEYRAQVYADQVCKMLDSERFALFKRGFRDWIENHAWKQADMDRQQKKRLAKNLLKFAVKALDKQERRVIESGDNINRESAQEMHRLRIECKKLRYASEFFCPLFSDMDAFIHHMKGLQDLLGLMNDISVTQHLFDVLLGDSDDQEVHAYAGSLIGWRTNQYYHMLADFDAYWKELMEAECPWRT
jgi:CHAD domain-containing protein